MSHRSMRQILPGGIMDIVADPLEKRGLERGKCLVGEFSKVALSTLPALQ
jgi:hypothetical protein